MGAKEEIIKVFYVKDGLRMKQLPKFGVTPVIITGRTSSILKKRAQELGITELYQGVSNKVLILNDILHKYCLTYENVAYIGDDENDYNCMRLCALKGCPANASATIIKIADFVSKYNGGEGAVREFLDFILQNKLNDYPLESEY